MPDLSRRSFLQASAAGLAGVVLGSRAAAAAGDLTPDIALGVQSYTFRNFDLEPALKRMKELGLANAEFYSKHLPPGSGPDKLQELLKLSREYGVAPAGFGVTPFSKDHDANRKTFEFGKALGVRYLSADPSPDSFDSLDKLCDEYKIAVAIHPHGPSGNGRHRWYSAEVILAAVKDRHPLIGACLDTGHLIRMAQLGEKLDPAQQVRLMGARNFGMHLKDHDNKRKEDVPFGDPAGLLDVGAVLKALKDVHFKGVISIEYEANPQDPSPDVKRCVEATRAAARKLG